MENQANLRIGIERGKYGFFLKVGDYYIRREWNGVITLTRALQGSPWIANEWASIPALRKFWNDYRIILITMVELRFKKDLKVSQISKNI